MVDSLGPENIEPTCISYSPFFVSLRSIYNEKEQGEQEKKRIIQEEKGY